MRHRALAFAAAAAALAPQLRAQSSAEINAGIQYNFSSPGAHSLARAGAFIGDASDATAAYTNPAGLVNVASREASLELRASDYINTYSAAGHVPDVTTGAGIELGHSSNRRSNLAFASLVFPLDRYFGDRRVTIAAYEHELANFAASQSTQGVSFDTPEAKGFRLLPNISSLRLRIGGEGVAAGIRLTDRLSVGLGAREYRSDFDSITRRFLTEGGAPDYTSPHSTQTQHGGDRTLGVNAGMLFDATERLSFGATFRQGFSFPINVEYIDFAGTVGTPRPTQRGRFNVPSFYGVGTSIRPTDAWAVALDVNRITYSDTTRGFVYLFEEEPHYFVPDGTEIRLGTEYTLTRDRFPWLPCPLYVAAGTWRDPDHSIRANDPSDSQSIIFRRTSADIHVTAGAGVIIGTLVQIHAAVDHSRRQTVASVSAGARF